MLSLESVFLKHDNRIRDVNLYLDGFCLRPSQLDLMLDRTFERSFGLSVGFSLVRYSVLGSAQINSVRKAGLTIYGSVLLELSASDVRPYKAGLMKIYNLFVETNETVRYIQVSVEGGFTWIQINHIFEAHSNMAVNGAMPFYFYFYIFKKR